MAWNTIVIVVCLVLAVLAVWQELRRENRLRLAWRILAVVVAIASLACIALPISYSAKTSIGEKGALLLTPGFTADSLSKYPRTQLFTTDNAIKKANPGLNITLVSDLNDFAKKRYPVAALDILGYGLDEGELDKLQGFPVRYGRVAVPSGVVAINWDKHLKAGERLTLQGEFGNTSDEKIRLVLRGSNTGLDSVEIPARDTKTFTLGCTPKSIGRTSYDLLAVAGKDTIEKETIPFETEPAKPLKVLMLASAPDFENRFLKDWLSKNGYGLTIRTNISKAKFSREYFNMPQTPVENITGELLSKFDVVIGDLSAFKTLSAAETGVLKEQLSAKGLGVIVKADSSKGNSFLSGAFPAERLNILDQRNVPLFINGKGAPSAKLSLDAVAIQNQGNTQPLVNDGQNHILTSSSIYGSGKIVYTLLSNTYTWALAGSNSDYTSLWSALIGKAARKTPVTQMWSVWPGFPKVNAPVHVGLEGPVNLPVKVSVQNSLLAFAQNAGVPFKWDATYWPKAGGWQQISQNNVPAYWWYVYQSGDWSSLLARQKMKATEKYVAKSSVNPTPSIITESEVKVPVSKLYFYLLLLLACVYLWIERKL
ncbi:hypothetical protein ACFGVR_12325 [Mucilaginibacter sp. AW1-3]